MIRMKALKSFFGDEGRVRGGREFEVKDQRRADALAKRKLAVMVDGPALQDRGVVGPLPAAGGPTGAGSGSSLSPPAQAPAPSESSEPEAKPASSPSTNPGGSRRGRTSSTAATEAGGASDQASLITEG